MRALAIVLLALAACGDNHKPQQLQDAGTDSQGVVGCVDPGLARPPADRLPCDLVPPGLAP
jgi:hypothetical protein